MIKTSNEGPQRFITKRMQRWLEDKNQDPSIWLNKGYPGYTSKSENPQDLLGRAGQKEYNLDTAPHIKEPTKPPHKPKLTEGNVKYFAPSQNSNAPYTQRMTGTKIPAVDKDKKDPTIPEKTSNINDKAKPDGVLNEALPLFAGASVGTAFCFTALALGGVVPVLTVGALLVLGGLGLYQAHEQKNDKAPSERVVIKNLSRIKDEDKLFLS